MSATMEGNLRLFTKYFGEKVEVKHIDIPSRLFTVERFFLGDVIAMTGFVPEESMFSSMFMSAGFPEVCSFPTVGDWSMKPEWEQDHQVHGRLPEAMTAPNLQSLAGAAPSSSNQMAGGHMMTSSSVASFPQHGKQQHTANFMNVAQQLVNSQHSSSGHQQQPPQPMSAPPQGVVHHPQQQPTMPGYVQPQGTIYVQQSAYQQGYPQPHGFPQGQIRQVYTQQPGAVAMPHSTWGGNMDQSFNGVVHAHPDVVDLPSEAIDPETMEQFRQMGYANNEDVGPAVTYGAEWRVAEGEVQPQWQHTQSYSAMPNAGYQQGHLQSWDTQVVYATAPAPYHKVCTRTISEIDLFYTYLELSNTTADVLRAGEF
ncbi:unnamed protein product [Cylicostephanus goldi]|uniref:Uncharacterized protein n=1 Tax=Cylicostephanus goldi TaxID=71465 RepID=A0A3P6R611_CYLGO|nr:unnamed protein product [Cylicostephanus goldi]